MTRYYAMYDDSGKLLAVGVGGGGTKITEDEYTTLQGEIAAKSEYVTQVYTGKIGIDAVPEKWRNDVQLEVNNMIAEFGAPDERDISDSEALDIIMGVSE